MVEVRQARYFIAVAEELHFGRAADRLRMSQPPLSQAIRQIEKETGVTLLHRSSRAVSLTPAGAVFLDHCRLLVQQAQRADAAAVQAQNGFLGEVTIGAVTSAFSNLLPNTLASYRRSRPDVDLQVREIDTQVGAQAVLRQDLDVAIIRQNTAGSGCRVVPLHRDHFVAAVPATHPLATDPGPLDLASLGRESWVWLPREISPSYHDEMAAACRNAGFSPNARHLANSITSQIAMVACGLGVTIVPHSSATTWTGAVAYRPLHKSVPLVELSLICRDGSEPLIDFFVACAISAATEIEAG